MAKKKKKKVNILADNKGIIFAIILFFMVDICLYMYFSEKKDVIAKESKEQTEEKKEKEYKVSFKDDECIFLGDSLTDFYDFEKYYDFPIVNSGISGWTTDDILDHLDEKVFQYNPKVIVLFIGTNDLIHDRDSDYIVNNIKEIINRIKEEKTDVRIIVESLYPVNDTDDEKIDQEMVKNRTNEEIDNINNKLREYCDDENLYYMDINKYLKDEDGNFALEYTKEGLHCSEEGYEVVTKKIMEYFKDNKV